ncbi:MAG: c-type cytochrome [Gammaproteobacteria bacterium]|nr:c-type cytochrome [Gammaproteobacteria bacterium]
MTLTFNVNAASLADLDETIQQAISATPNLEKGKAIYRNCAVCHSPEGWGTLSGHYPQIAGQHKSVIIKQLEDIQLGNRDNPTMRPFTNPVIELGSQAVADVAAYISQLPMTPKNYVGFGVQLDRGKALYDKNCKQCHKTNGEGKPEKFYPRIQGQNYKYLQRQLLWIKTGKRRNADIKMVKQLRDFSLRDIDLVADYASRLRPDKSLVAKSIFWKNPDFRAGFRAAPRN